MVLPESRGFVLKRRFRCADKSMIHPARWVNRNVSPVYRRLEWDGWFDVMMNDDLKALAILRMNKQVSSLTLRLRDFA